MIVLTKAERKLNQVHSRLNDRLDRNMPAMQLVLRQWFDFVIKQVRKDITTKLIKDITTELTDWDFIEENGKPIIKPAALKIMQTGGQEAYKLLAIEGAFDVLNVKAVKAAEKFTAELVTSTNKETKAAVRTYIADGIKQGKGMEKVGRELRSVVGLNDKQVRTSIKYRTLLEDKEKYPKLMTTDINRKVIRQEQKMLRQRGVAIARTETARAQNIGYVQGLESIGVEMVEFSASPGACEELCLPKHGAKYKTVEAEGIIPVHPNCRCALLPVVAERVVDKPQAKPPDEVSERMITPSEIESNPDKANGLKFDKEVEGRVLARYTSFEHEEIVQAQLGKKLPSWAEMTQQQALQRAKKIEKSLLKLDGWKGVSYRGMKFETSAKQKAFLKQFKVNGVHKFKAFQSTTTSEKVAKSFMGTSKNNVELVINGKSGRDVMAFSRNVNEKEILFMKNATFKVDKVVGNIVHLTEL